MYSAKSGEIEEKGENDNLSPTVNFVCLAALSLQARILSGVFDQRQTRTVRWFARQVCPMTDIKRVSTRHSPIVWTGL